MKNKWRNLRDCYIKHKKFTNGSTSSAANKYQNWPWSSLLQFLDDSLLMRSTGSNIRESKSQTPDTLTMETLSVKPSTESAAESITPTSSSSQMPPPKRIKNTDSNDDVQRLINYLDRKNRSKPHYDEVDHLFLSYAETFKRFSPRRQATLKMDLANLFGKAELSEIEEIHPAPPPSSPNNSTTSSVDSDSI